MTDTPDPDEAQAKRGQRRTMKIDPAQAMLMVQAATPVYLQGRLNGSRTLTYARAMTAGEWDQAPECQHDTIIMTDHGFLVNGLSRLMAVIVSGTTQTFMVETVDSADHPDWMNQLGIPMDVHEQTAEDFADQRPYARGLRDSVDPAPATPETEDEKSQRMWQQVVGWMNAAGVGSGNADDDPGDDDDEEDDDPDGDRLVYFDPNTVIEIDPANPPVPGHHRLQAMMDHLHFEGIMAPEYPAEFPHAQPPRAVDMEEASKLLDELAGQPRPVNQAKLRQIAERMAAAAVEDNDDEDDEHPDDHA